MFTLTFDTTVSKVFKTSLFRSPVCCKPHRAHINSSTGSTVRSHPYWGKEAIVLPWFLGAYAWKPNLDFALEARLSPHPPTESHRYNMDVFNTAVHKSPLLLLQHFITLEFCIIESSQQARVPADDWIIQAFVRVTRFYKNFQSSLAGWPASWRPILYKLPEYNSPHLINT